jgi:GNAT superfamily N-acetyltransferase
VTFALEPLGPDHELDAFACGNEELDRWLAEHARHATGQGTRTYVVTDGGGVVAGYFAIAPHTIDREVLSKSQGRGAPRQIPAVLLAKLALDRSAQGQGLGSELLIVALETIVEAARFVGGKVVVVDAIDAAASAFYERHDFVATPSDPHRLVCKLSTIAKALALVWP